MAQIKTPISNEKLESAQIRALKIARDTKKMTSETVEDAYANIFGTKPATSAKGK